MKRILAISDIHGYNDKLLELLDKVGYNAVNDKLILMGDYCDRGLQSKEVVDTCINLRDKNTNTVFLTGNHDTMFINWLMTESYQHKAMFINNGGLQTIESYLGRDWVLNGLTHENYQYAKKFIIDNYYHHVKFLMNNDYYYELSDHVFVHAGVNPRMKDWRNTSKENMLWIRDEFIFKKHLHREIIVHGHTPARIIHDSDDIHFGDRKIGIDGGVCFKGQLNCLEITASEDGNYKYKQYNV